MNNIIKEYTDFIKKELLKFYRILLGKDYNKSIIEPLLDRYIEVRYYNETNYPKEKDFIERLSKELQKLINTMINPENEEIIKNIYSLFVYVCYFDDCYFIESNKDLIEFFFQDENIKIEFTSEVKQGLKEFLKRLNINKDRFHDVFRTNQFSLTEKRLKRSLYKLTINQHVRISNLYSDYAIEKAFNTGTINEDKMFILFIAASELVLQNAKSLDFSRKYIIDFVTTFFEKEKKVERILSIIDNNLAKKHLIINIRYADYLLYKDIINNLIKEGYSFSVTLDNTFDENYSNLIIFSYVFLYADNEFYDIIKENKENIMSKLVILK